MREQRNAMRATPNWTGRYPRTSEEAFGIGRRFEVGTRRRGTLDRLATAAYATAVIIALGALLGTALFGNP